MGVAFASYSHFFSKNISIYTIFNDQSLNDTLLATLVSFEQLRPDISHVAPQKTYEPAHGKTYS